MPNLRQIERLATEAITKQPEQSAETTRSYLEMIHDLASDSETVHLVLWQDEPGPWGTQADLSQAGVKVFDDAKNAMSFYNDKREEFILDARPDLTADELEADFFDDEREELLCAIQQDVPYGQYDLRMVAVPIS